jgi:hypothetical protein
MSCRWSMPSGRRPRRGPVWLAAVSASVGRAGPTGLCRGRLGEAAVVDGSTTGLARAIGAVVKAGQRLLHVIEELVDGVDGCLGRPGVVGLRLHAVVWPVRARFLHVVNGGLGLHGR